MDLTLVRDVAAASYTYGTLSYGDGLPLQTLELPWLPLPGALCGRPDVSCVPAGVYQLALHDTPAHPHTWALVNAELNVFHESADAPPGGGTCRFACLIHVANIPSELEGCIGVGRTRETARPPGIWQSADAFRALQAAVPWMSGHTLTISYAAGVTPP
jgi:Family of unknown function (DUF5675)